MANTYKNIVITPNRDTDAANVPVIRFSGGDATSNTDINLRVYTTQSGTLSFEGSAGQLFSITNDLTNTIFSVNDVSGIPSLEIDANGLIKLAEYSGNVAVGRANANYKLDVNGGVNASAILINDQSISPLGQQTIWIPAGAMIPRTNNGAQSGLIEMTTNRNMLSSLDFDATTQEFAQFTIQMPKSWNESTLIAQFVWSHPTTTTNFGVVWAIEAVALANNEVADAAFGSQVLAVHTGGVANTIYITNETNQLTVNNVTTSEEFVMFQVKRNVTNSNDTMAVDARLHGVKIHYTIDDAKDD